jgi:Helicase conserved C-terminal domain
MHRGEGQLYAGLLASALHEMGLVSLAYPCDPEATGTAPLPAEWFQLTPLGAVALADGPVGEEASRGLWFTPEERPLIVQPSSELLLLQPAMPVLYQLIHWAEIKRIGPVSTLTLTQKAFLRGMAAGYSAQQVLTLLTQQGRKDLAQNVAYNINDWARSFKGATLAEVILVDTSSEQVALDLLRLLEESRIEARTLTPCTLAIFPAGASLLTLRRLLEKVGVFVREDARNAVRRPSYR